MRADHLSPTVESTWRVGHDSKNALNSDRASDRAMTADIVTIRNLQGRHSAYLGLFQYPPYWAVEWSSGHRQTCPLTEKSLDRGGTAVGSALLYGGLLVRQRTAPFLDGVEHPIWGAPSPIDVIDARGASGGHVQLAHIEPARLARTPTAPGETH